MALSGHPEPHAFRLRRGGPHNQPHRITWQLTEHDCRKLLRASDAAWDAGAPFTRFATFAWQLGGFDPRHCAAMTARFLDLLRDWLAYRGYPLAWAWVQECGPVLGAHCHVLFHVPWELDEEFRPWPLRWVKALLGRPYTKGVLDCQSLYGRKAAYTNPEFYRATLRCKLHYMMKCAPAPLEAKLGMCDWGEKPWGQSGQTFGKRAGVWQWKGREALFPHVPNRQIA